MKFYEIMKFYEMLSQCSCGIWQSMLIAETFCKQTFSFRNFNLKVSVGFASIDKRSEELQLFELSNSKSIA